MAFDATYPGQGIVVINRGLSGWPIERTVQELRRRSRHSTARMRLLLLSGYNNLLNECGRGPADTMACKAAIDTIRFGVRDASGARRTRGSAYMFVSTLTPPGPVLAGAPRDRRISNDAIVQANTRIRQMVSAEGADPGRLVSPVPRP